MTAGSEARSWLRDHKTTMKRVATGVFVCIVIALLVRVGMTIEWDEVVDAILDTSPAVLWTAVPLVIASYCVYACYDILGKRYTGHDLPWWQCMKVAFISYAFTMNFSAAVGGLAMRLRLYGKYGLAPGEIMRIMGLSITTNWIGYCMLAGLIFASGAIKPPGEWGIGGGWLRVVGGLLVVVALAYLALSAFSKRRSWKIRDHTIELPDLRTAVLQVALSMVNWSIMGLIVYILMPGEIAYPTILGCLLVGAIVGSVAHIPGGLGVTEYVFITLLSPELPRHQVLGAILVYRALYYIAPVLVAGAWYLLMEARSSTQPSHGTEVA
ncbi:MAG TPA: lysylphosphatidylglycerol synthase domain-containing protein [Burkholderiaceae bacterium]|nr:lysylphosphatidylglycerol synthase domain-containing protein [Burkholderiaceae bacterium]